MSRDTGPCKARAATRWLVVLALWTLPGLVSSTQVYYIQQRYEPIGLGNALLWQMAGWYFWLPATPLVLWLGRRFPLDRSTMSYGALAWSVAVHVAAALALAVPHMALSTLAGRLAGAPHYGDMSFTHITTMLLLKHVHLDLVTYVGVLAAGVAFDYYRRYRAGLLIASTLEAKLVQAQLEALKMQLHPHFLFNTLHAIGVLVRKQDTKGALGMLTGLAGLLRATLDSAGKQLVPLEQELAFLERYLRIEETRFGDRLHVVTDIDPEMLGALVPNLALQPLVENAIRHGIAPRVDGGTIEIRAQRQGDRLLLQVSDDGVGLAEDSAEYHGVGLGNVRARLQQLYGKAHRFEIADRTGGGVFAIMEIPLDMGASKGTP